MNHILKNGYNMKLKDYLLKKLASCEAEDLAEIIQTAHVRGWPRGKEGEAISAENFQINEIADDHIIVSMGGDWQDPVQATFKFGANKAFTCVNATDTADFSSKVEIKGVDTELAAPGKLLTPPSNDKVKTKIYMIDRIIRSTLCIKDIIDKIDLAMRNYAPFIWITLTDGSHAKVNINNIQFIQSI